MTRVYIQIEPLVIEMDGPLALNTGFRRGLIHRTVERDADGLAYIPASSLKGRVRRACEQVARQSGLRVCHAPRPGGMCSAHEQACLVCRVFGSPGRGSELHWQDARLAQDYRSVFSGDEANREAQFYARTQVQLSRGLGTAAPDRLFTSEFTVENLEFRSAITGWLDVTPIAGDDTTGGYELLLLLAGLRLVNTLGSGSSRGSGHCVIRPPEQIALGERPIRIAEVLENLELLGEFDKEAGNGN
ncbi:MAG: RAMP superfamily CRISPR-associated protein [Anaerolineae bacterium]|jgi:CRISPR/Cas system CSM-associated protein Csm3 (group 7 of RAMP superfamily)|nr:RAMP superfamily CRISPR-associated protein [Anaerolineae bacterium]MDH7475146.1 RAMP superfamily CRISPR-associated protein [Anaerolineae bacterium]